MIICLPSGSRPTVRLPSGHDPLPSRRAWRAPIPERNRMYDDVSEFDGALEQIAGLIDQVRGKLGDRFLRLELADKLAPKSTPFRVPSGLGAAIDKRIVPAGLGALQLCRALRDRNKDVPRHPAPT